MKCSTQWVNDSVPVEMVVMQIRALIRQLENNYCDAFDKDTGSDQKK